MAGSAQEHFQGGESQSDPSLRREHVTMFAKGDLFVSKLIVFRIACLRKHKKVTASRDGERRKEHGQDCLCEEKRTDRGAVFGVLCSHSCYADFSLFCRKHRQVKDL
jgi:hypothetical protein